ncbi:MAG: acyl-CoA reductase [Gemmatimonadota bacterium]
MRSAADAPRLAPAPLAIADAAGLRRLKRRLAARARALRRSPLERADALAEVCRRWLEPQDPFRRAALESLAVEAGWEPALAAAGLDATFGPWSRASWRGLVRRELGSAPKRPDVVPHVLGGALPGPNVLPIFLTLLAGRAPLVRAGRHVPAVPAIAVASVAAVDAELARLGAAVRWRRERNDLTRELFAGAEVGSATGGDAAVAALRDLAAPGTRLLEHADRVSFAYVAAGALREDDRTARTASALARDVALHDQQGCLSPLGVLVEGGDAAARRFARALAAALDERQRTWPRSPLAPAQALSVRAFHDALALEAAGSDAVLAGEGLAWIVGRVARDAPLPPPARLRCVWIRRVRGPAEAREALAAWRGAVAALGFRGSAVERSGARELARALGASRLCALGRMQSPPLGWRRDGVSPLASLVAALQPSSRAAARPSLRTRGSVT